MKSMLTEKKSWKTQKGITLIALVVTIIVLLILAGISIMMLTGQNGILVRAKEASDKTNIANEKEAIEFWAIDVKTNSLIDGTDNNSIGEKLSNKNLGTDWKTIVVDGKSYGTNWYFLEKGTKMENGTELERSWLVNYETGEIIELEENKYSKLTGTDTAVESAKENIIFNLDGTIIDKATNMNDLQWSDGSEPVGFEDENENSGLAKNSFKFDGIDDYIKIRYDDSQAIKSDGTPYTNENGEALTKKQVLEQNGFTFEFYGKWQQGTIKYQKEDVQKIEDDSSRGLFCFRKGNVEDLSSMWIKI